jgi:hypothetical protein
MANAVVNSAMLIDLFGHTINLMHVMILIIFGGLVTMFWRIQRSDKLDFSDMITKDGRSVSLTKVLQLIGGTTATWIVVKLAISGTLGADIFGIYLMYVASIEGFSKFMTAKYQYSEGSVKDNPPTQITRVVKNPTALDPDTGPTGSAKTVLDDIDPKIK